MFHLNHSAFKGYATPAQDALALGKDAALCAQQLIASCTRYEPTELHYLPSLARSLGVRDVFAKDETDRMGLGSFKALGGAHAVFRLILEHAACELGRSVDVAEVHGPTVRGIAETLTFACATDGNHGRSVAASANRVGAHAVVFVHAGVSERRVQAIKDQGAEIRRVSGVYDDSVAEVRRHCITNGWIDVSDISRNGDKRIPRLVMQGYTVMVREILEHLDSPVTHVFLQAGVGGLAAAVAAHMSLVLESRAPRFIVVEPDAAACIYQSSISRRPIRVPQKNPTVMAMLECFEPSHIAWEIIVRRVDAFMTITDSEAVKAMRRFAVPEGRDPPIISGESGGVGLAGLLAATADRNVAGALGLSPQSRVLLINTEGATDPEIYRSLTGLDSSLVRPAPFDGTVKSSTDV